MPKISRKRYVSTAITLPSEMVDQMKKVVEKRGMSSVSDLLRTLFRDYYEHDFRISYYGHQKGIEFITNGDDPLSAGSEAKTKKMRSIILASLGSAYDFMKANGFVLAEGCSDDYISGGNMIHYRYGQEEVVAPVSMAIKELKLSEHPWLKVEENVIKTFNYLNDNKGCNTIGE